MELTYKGPRELGPHCRAASSLELKSAKDRPSVANLREVVSLATLTLRSRPRESLEFTHTTFSL